MGGPAGKGREAELAKSLIPEPVVTVFVTKPVHTSGSPGLV